MLTLQLGAATDVSVFLLDEDLLVDAAGTVHRGLQPGPLELVVHGRRTPGDDRALASALGERVIVLGHEVDDVYVSGEGERSPLGRHKIGGRPGLFKHWELEEEIAGALVDGYVQLAQLDIPGPGDDPGVGSWPFCDGMFHLLAREPFGEADWICFWEM